MFFLASSEAKHHNTTTTKYSEVHLKQEQTAKKGKPYTLDCSVAPDEEGVDITWKDSKHIIKNGK